MVAQTLYDTPTQASFVAVGSLSSAILRCIKELLPEILLIAIVNDEEMFLEHAANNPDIFALHKDLVTDARVIALHSAAKKVWAWNVDEEEQMLEVIEAGVDGVITNCPRTACELRRFAIKGAIIPK